MWGAGSDEPCSCRLAGWSVKACLSPSASVVYRRAASQGSDDGEGGGSLPSWSEVSVWVAGWVLVAAVVDDLQDLDGTERGAGRRDRQ
jgi:hypothetical protein